MLVTGYDTQKYWVLHQFVSYILNFSKSKFYHLEGRGYIGDIVLLWLDIFIDLSVYLHKKIVITRPMIFLWKCYQTILALEALFVGQKNSTQLMIRKMYFKHFICCKTACLSSLKQLFIFLWGQKLVHIILMILIIFSPS